MLSTERPGNLMILWTAEDTEHREAGEPNEKAEETEHTGASPSASVPRSFVHHQKMQTDHPYPGPAAQCPTPP